MCISRYQYILIVQALNTDKTWFRAAKEKVMHIVGYDSLSLNDATKIISALRCAQRFHFVRLVYLLLVCNFFS